MAWRLFKNNKTRSNIIGFAFIIIMAGLIYFSYIPDADAGCTGDCMSCHPKLIDSKDHESLKTCITCHNPENKKPKFALSINGDSGCGTKCFECHKEWPRDSAHVSLDTCMPCHNNK